MNRAESYMQEASQSRFFGGIHCMLDCDAGLVVGEEIGMKVVKDMELMPHTFIFK